MTDGKKDFGLDETLASPAGTPSVQTEPTAVHSVGLAVGTVVDGHYVIESVLGRGGMGTVYLARDTTLGRPVALKLHRHGSGNDRLYREALAMAQLAHPNVVTVYEVGTSDDQLYVAMEYVKGTTLRGWLQAVPREWGEVARMLLEVGEGLAAAHRAELVHRDFKPENVLVGVDARPRVTDFGLARGNAAMTASLAGNTPSVETPPRAVGAATISTSSSMTETGTVLGTPAYMSPEQFAGANVDAPSDQFAFCVAAWECFYGMRPFPGANLAAIQQAIERGQMDAPAKTDVPVSVRRVLVRGLAPRAEDRWPDMRALLAALRAAVEPRRGPAIAIAAAAVGVLAIGGGAAWWHWHGEAAPSCELAGAEVDALVPAELRARVVALAHDKGNPEVARRTEQHVAAFVGAYRDHAARACRLAASHDWSAELAESGAWCRAQAAAVAAAELRRVRDAAPTGRDIDAAMAELADRAELPPCADASALAAMPPPPAGDRAAIAEARADLVVAHRTVGTDGPTFARATVARIAGSPLAKAPELEAALGLARAASARKDEQFDAAIREATDAYYRAHARADQTLEALALHDLLEWYGSRQDLKGSEPWFRLAVSELERFERASPLRAAPLRIAVAELAVERDELKVAVEQAKRAVDDSAQASDAGRAQAHLVYADMLATAGEVDRSLPIYEQAQALFERTFGADAPQLVHALGNEALTLSDAARHPQAVKVAERTLAIIRASGERTFELANTELNVAVVFFRADDDARAEPLFVDAKTIVTDVFGPKHPLIATLDSNLALIAQDKDDLAAAETLLRDALAIQEASLGAEHTDVAATLFNLAAVLDRKHDPAAALPVIDRCVAIRAKGLPDSDLYVFALAMRAALENELHRSENALRDARAALSAGGTRSDFQATTWPQFESGRALLALHRDAEARELLTKARAVYADNHMDKKVGEIDALLAPRSSSER